MNMNVARGLWRIFDSLGVLVADERYLGEQMILDLASDVSRDAERQ